MISYLEKPHRHVKPKEAWKCMLSFCPSDSIASDEKNTSDRQNQRDSGAQFILTMPNVRRNSRIVK